MRCELADGMYKIKTHMALTAWNFYYIRDGIAYKWRLSIKQREWIWKVEDEADLIEIIGEMDWDDLNPYHIYVEPSSRMEFLLVTGVAFEFEVPG